MPAIDFSDLMPAQGQASAPSTVGASAAGQAPASGGPIDFSDLMPRTWLDTAKDVAQSAATGIEKGAIGMVTALPAAERFVRGGFNKALDHVLPQPSKRISDLVREQTGAGVAPQPPEVSDYLSVAGAERAAAALGQPFYQLQTKAGQRAETVGEFIPGATRNGFLGLLKYGVAPAIASQAAGEATHGTRLEPYARVGAALATGGAAALASRPGTAASALSDAAGALSAPTLARAQDLMDAAARQGSPLTLAEAVQQVTNGGTRLGSLQRVVEQSRGGAETMGHFYAGRPGQVQQAGSAAIDHVGTVPAVPLDGSIGPVYPNTSAIGPGVQRGAQAALDATQPAQDARAALSAAGPRVGAEQAGQVIQPALRGAYDERLAARSAQARRDYAAAGSDTVDPGDVQGILDDLDRQAAAKVGYLGAHIDDAMANTTINDLHNALAHEVPVYSVRDQGAVDEWNRYAVHRDAWEQQGTPNSRPARSGAMPVSVYRDEFGAVAPAEPKRVPITDIETGTGPGR